MASGPIPFTPPEPLPVVIQNAEDIIIGTMNQQGSTDGGTTWVPVAVDAEGHAGVVIESAPVLSVQAPGTPVNGIGSFAAAQTDTALIADPGASKSIHITSLSITNDATHAVTVVIECDTTGAKTALTPVYNIPASGVLNLNFGAPGIVATVHKNVGVTTTQVSNITVHVVGYVA